MVPSDTIPAQFQIKMGKLNTSFQTKTAQKPYLWGGTYLYGLYKEAIPPPSPPLGEAVSLWNLKLYDS